MSCAVIDLLSSDAEPAIATVTAGITSSGHEDHYINIDDDVEPMVGQFDEGKLHRTGFASAVNDNHHKIRCSYISSEDDTNLPRSTHLSNNNDLNSWTKSLKIMPDFSRSGDSDFAQESDQMDNGSEDKNSETVTFSKDLDVEFKSNLSPGLWHAELPIAKRRKVADDFTQEVTSWTPFRTPYDTRMEDFSAFISSPSIEKDDFTRSDTLEDSIARTQVSSRTTALLAEITDSTNIQRKQMTKERSTKSTVNRTKKDSAKGREGTPDSANLVMDASYPKSVLSGNTARKVQSNSKERETETQEKNAGKARKAKEKEDKKEKRRLEKEQKTRETQIAKEIAEVNKAKVDKSVTAKEMIVDLSPSMTDTSIDIQIREHCRRLDVMVTTCTDLIPNTLKWRRKVSSTFNDDAGKWEPIDTSIVDEKHVLCMLSAKEFMDLAISSNADVNAESLELNYLKLRSIFVDCRVIYIIEGLDAHVRKIKTSKNRIYQAAVLSEINGDTAAPLRNPRQSVLSKLHVDESTVEDALIRLQVNHGCLIHHTATTSETAEWIIHFTQHISQIPEK